jgi:hypothetical protein
MQTLKTEPLLKLSSQYSAEEIWRQLRCELKPAVIAAHEIIEEFEGSIQLGELLGLGIISRQRRVAVICNYVPKSADELVKGLRLLQTIPTAPEATELFERFLGGVGQRFSSALLTLISAAIESVEKKQAMANEIEKRVFLDAGLPQQSTSISTGPSEVSKKLKQVQQNFSTPGHGFPQPTAGHLPELFIDASAAWQAKLSGTVVPDPDTNAALKS